MGGERDRGGLEGRKEEEGKRDDNKETNFTLSYERRENSKRGKEGDGVSHVGV